MGIAAAVPYTSAAKADRGNSSWVPPMRPYAVKGLGTPSKNKHSKTWKLLGWKKKMKTGELVQKAMSSRVGLIPNLPLACQRLMRQLAISNDSSVHPRILDGARPTLLHKTELSRSVQLQQAWLTIRMLLSGSKAYPTTTLRCDPPMSDGAFLLL